MNESEFEDQFSDGAQEGGDPVAPRRSLNDRLMGQPAGSMQASDDGHNTSLNDRLMAQASSAAADPLAAEYWQAEPPPDEYWEAQPEDEALPSSTEWPPAAAQEGHQVVDQLAARGGVVQVSPGLVERPLQEARRYIRLRYSVFLASVLLMLGLAVIIGLALLVMLAAGSGSGTLAIMAALEGLAVVLLLFLQYRPARSFGSAAWQVAQLEATRAQLNKSFQIWERFLAEREESRPLSAQDVALAVSSLNTAAQGLFQFEQKEREFEQKSRRKLRSAGAEAQPARAAVNPNPRRY
jgi:hypothetical protein